MVAATRETQIIPRSCDILCGKERMCQIHSGSQIFRKLIDQFSDEYQNKTDKFGKMSLTREVYFQAAKASRFLKFNRKKGEWEELSAAAARDKVSHALRFSALRKKKQQGQSNRARELFASLSSSSPIPSPTASAPTTLSPVQSCEEGLSEHQTRTPSSTMEHQLPPPLFLLSPSTTPRSPVTVAVADTTALAPPPPPKYTVSPRKIATAKDMSSCLASDMNDLMELFLANNKKGVSSKPQDENKANTMPPNAGFAPNTTFLSQGGSSMDPTTLLLQPLRTTEGSENKLFPMLMPACVSPIQGQQQQQDHSCLGSFTWDIAEEDALTSWSASGSFLQDNLLATTTPSLADLDRVNFD